MQFSGDLENSSSYVPLSEMFALYHRQQYRRTPVSELFWSLSNLQLLVQRLEHRLSELTAMNIQFKPDDGFFLEASNLVAATANQPDVQQVVQVLNEAVIDQTIPVHMQAIKRRKLFLKYYIHQDRQRVMAPPRDTHGRHRFARPSAHAYNLENPDKNSWHDYQRHVDQQREQCAHPSLFDIYF